MIETYYVVNSIKHVTKESSLPHAPLNKNYISENQRPILLKNYQSKNISI